MSEIPGPTPGVPDTICIDSLRWRKTGPTVEPNSRSLESMHQEGLSCRPHLDDLIRTRGAIRVGTWCEDFCTSWATPPATDDPLFHSVYSHTVRILGTETASHLTAHLEAMPNVLTSNHLGLDCYSQTLQGTLLFALARLRQSKKPHPFFPVLACGNISLNNLTYPQGMLLARKIQTPIGHDETKWAAAKIPIFPRRLQHALAGRLDAYTPEMLRKARKIALAGSSPLLHSEKQAVLELLDAIYPLALEHTRFSDQCTLLNTRAWQPMFAPELSPVLPQPVYLGLETICTDLLKSDLTDPDCLVHSLFFDPALCGTLMTVLDDKVGCWSRRGLHAIRSNQLPVHNQSKGTLFFWTIDRKGCKMPMDLIKGTTGTRLIPVRSTPQTRGEEWTPSAITEALQEGRILPSLFTCYAALALARGLVCHGGIYQTEYLPAMQAGVTKTLRSRGYTGNAKRIERVRTNGFCSGHNLAMARYPDTTCIPAGRIEFMAGGGITPTHLEKMARLTLKEASLAALAETFAPFLSPRLQSHQEYIELNNRISARLGENIPCFEVT